MPSFSPFAFASLPLLFVAATCCPLSAAEPGPGFQNISRDEGPGRLLSAGHRETHSDNKGNTYTHADGVFAGNIGRTTVIDVHRGWLVMAAEAPGSLLGNGYSSIDHRLYDLSDPGNPILIDSQKGQAGYHTHGSFKSGNTWRSGKSWTINDDGSFGGEQAYPMPKHRGNSSWTGWSRSVEWSYGLPSDPFWIERYDPESRDWVRYGDDPADPWNTIVDTGVIGFGFIIGNLLVKAADQSQTGVATYDISDPANPILLDVINTDHGIGSYWPGIWRHYVIAERGNVLHAVDFSDPTDLSVTAIPMTDADLGGSGEGMSHNAHYMSFQDEFLFIDRFKVDLSPLEEGGKPVIVQALPRQSPGIGFPPRDQPGTSQWALPLGNQWIAGGYGSAQGASVWLHDPDPSTPDVCEADTRGPTVDYHIPQDGQIHASTITPIVLLVHETIETSRLNYGRSVFLREVDGTAPVDGSSFVDCMNIVFSMDDFLTITPKTDLQPGTEYEVILTTDALTDAVGNPLQDQTGPGDTIVVDGNEQEIAYRFSFTTDDGTDALPTITELAFSPQAPISLDVNGNAIVRISARTEDADGDALEYLMVYGDGDETDPSESNDGRWADVPTDGMIEEVHNFTRPGNFRVLLRVREKKAAALGAYRTAAQVTSILVNEPQPEHLPQQSTTVVVDDAAGIAWAVNPDNDSIARIDADAASYRLLDEIPVGRHPAGIARDRHHRVWVPCRDDDSLHVLKLDGTPAAIFTPDNSPLAYGDRPVSIVFAPDGRYGYVALEGRSTVLKVRAGVVPTIDSVLPERHGLNAEVYNFSDGVDSVDDLTMSAPWEKRTDHNFKMSVGTWSGGLNPDIREEFFAWLARRSEGSSWFFRGQWNGRVGMTRNYGIVYRGLLDIAEGEVPVGGGPVTFTIEAAGAFRLTVNGAVVAEDATVRSDSSDPLLSDSGTIRLTPGRHEIELRHYALKAGHHLEVRYQAAGIPDQMVPAERLFPLQEQRQLGAAAINADGTTLLVAQRISDDHAGRIAHYDLKADAWAEQPLFLFRDWYSGNSEISGEGVPNYVSGLAFTFDADRAWYVAEKANTHTGLVRGMPSKGDPTPIFENTIRFQAGLVDTDAERPLFAEPWNIDEPLLRVDFDNHGQPSAITTTPLGTQVVIAAQGMNRVLVLDAYTGREIDRGPTGLAPQGLFIRTRADGEMELWVQNLTDRTVSVFDATAIFRRGVRSLATTDRQQVATIAREARMDATEVRGKQLFYAAAEIDADKQPTEIQDPTRMAQDGYLSCASCHLDGGHDGRTWDFTHRGEGLRNTISLRGRSGMTQGNVHWSANFDEIQDFENDIRAHFGGAGFLSDADFDQSAHPLGDPKSGRDADLDALASYVASLGRASVPRSPHRADDGGLTEAALAGRAVFAARDCTSCHVPDRGHTDSTRGIARLHDVGTLKVSSGERLGEGTESLSGIDTPSLLGLHATAPYLHDGSAGTVEAVFTQFHNGGAHDISALDHQQRRDLMAYLLQLDGRDENGRLDPDGEPQIAFTRHTIGVGEHRSSVSLQVARRGNADGAVGITWRTVPSNGANAATAGADYRADSGTLTWADGETGISSITIDLLDDDSAQEGGNETFAVVLGDPTGGATLAEPSLARVVLIENDLLTPYLQTLVGTRSAKDSDPVDGAGDTVADRFVVGNKSSSAYVSLPVFRLDSAFNRSDLWGVDLTITLADDQHRPGGMPNVDLYLMRISDTATIQPADFEADPGILLVDDLFTPQTDQGHRFQLSLAQQRDFLTLLRDQGAQAGDHLVLKAVADDLIPRPWAHYTLGDGDPYDPPRLEMVTLSEIEAVGRTIDIVVRPDDGAEAAIDGGPFTPLPASFGDLLQDDPHDAHIRLPLAADG